MNMISDLVQSTPRWLDEGEPLKVNLASRIRLVRNIVGFSFPLRLKNDDRLEVRTLIQNALKKIPELYHLVSKYSGLQIPMNYPVTGENAFTHCAGVHTQAAIRNPLHYQSLDPEQIGRKSEISLDHMSGLSAVRYSLEQIGEGDIDKNLALRILNKVKEVGQHGRTVDLVELKYIVRYLREHK